jgi:hypothetical protein
MNNELVRKALKELFAKQFKKGPRLYRQDSYSKPLREFDELQQFNLGDSMTPKGEPGGIYFAEHPYEVSPLVMGTDRTRNEVRSTKEAMRRAGVGKDLNVRPFDVAAAPLPSARVKSIGTTEWLNEYSKMPFDELTEKLKRETDFVSFPDVAAGSRNRQTVQLNPHKSIARLKDGTYKIIGLGGMGLVAGDMLSPGDAEAMPLGKPIHAAGKTFAEVMRGKNQLGDAMRKAGQVKPALSSASDSLKGMPLRGSKISGVYQGVGKRRYIHLENGQIYPTTRDSVHELAAEWGTQKYVQKFGQVEGEARPGGGAKWQQILKSLEMNEQRGVPPRAGGSKPTRMALLEKSLADRQGMLGESEIAAQVLVQSTKSKKWWLWPRVYAEPAEAAGLVRIDRAKNTLFTNEGL